MLSIEPTTGLAHALSGGHSTITYLSGGTELALVEVGSGGLLTACFFFFAVLFMPCSLFYIMVICLFEISTLLLDLG